MQYCWTVLMPSCINSILGPTLATDWAQYHNHVWGRTVSSIAWSTRFLFFFLLFLFLFSSHYWAMIWRFTIVNRQIMAYWHALLTHNWVARSLTTSAVWPWSTCRHSPELVRHILNVESALPLTMWRSSHWQQFTTVIKYTLSPPGEPDSIHRSIPQVVGEGCSWETPPPGEHLTDCCTVYFSRRGEIFEVCEIFCSSKIQCHRMKTKRPRKSMCT